jgi:hypothetical protein
MTCVKGKPFWFASKMAVELQGYLLQKSRGFGLQDRGLYFFRLGTLMVSVTVVFGLLLAVDFFTKRPETALLVIFLVAIISPPFCIRIYSFLKWCSLSIYSQPRPIQFYTTNSIFCQDDYNIL